MTAPAPRASAATSPCRQIPQDPHVPRLLPISPTSTVSRATSPSSSPNSTSLPVPLGIFYPLLPSMDPRELPHFQKGAQIALENILDDYQRNPEMSLLEVITDLDDKRPVVGVAKDEWERRYIVEDAIWAGEAVARWWEDWFGQAEDSEKEGWEDDAGDKYDGNSKHGDKSMKSAAFGTVGDVGEVDGTRQGHDPFSAEEEVERFEAGRSMNGRSMNGHPLGNAGFNDTSTAHQEVEQIADEDGKSGDTAIHQGPGVDHIMSPLDKVNNSNDMISDGAGTVEAIDGGQSDGEETSQDAKETRVVVCMLSLLGR